MFSKTLLNILQRGLVKKSSFERIENLLQNPLCQTKVNVTNNRRWRCMLIRLLTLFSLITILFSYSPKGFAVPHYYIGDSDSQLWGKWKYIGFIYKGQFQNPPNPNLNLTFEFLQDGTDILYWNYTNEQGFCERKGEYSYDGTHLTDKIVWVNPKNSIECQRDPDMTTGRLQITPVKRVDDQLHLDIPLSDDTLIYILALTEN